MTPSSPDLNCFAHCEKGDGEPSKSREQTRERDLPSLTESGGSARCGEPARQFGSRKHNPPSCESVPSMQREPFSPDSARCLVIDEVWAHLALGRHLPDPVRCETETEGDKAGAGLPVGRAGPPTTGGRPNLLLSTALLARSVEAHSLRRDRRQSHLGVRELRSSALRVVSSR